MFFPLHFIITIQSITKILNQEVNSSWAYSHDSPRIMSMPKGKKRKSNPKPLNNPTAIYKQPKAIYASCIMHFFICTLMERESEMTGKCTAQNKA